MSDDTLPLIKAMVDPLSDAVDRLARQMTEENQRTRDELRAEIAEVRAAMETKASKSDVPTMEQVRDAVRDEIDDIEPRVSAEEITAAVTKALDNNSKRAQDRTVGDVFFDVLISAIKVVGVAVVVWLLVQWGAAGGPGVE